MGVKQSQAESKKVKQSQTESNKVKQSQTELYRFIPKEKKSTTQENILHQHNGAENLDERP